MNSEQTRSFSLGGALLLFCASNLLISALFLWFKIGLQPVSLLISCVFALLFLGKKPAIALVFTGIVGASFFVSSHFIDLSYDGAWYHQEAVIQLAHGWNPYHDAPVTPSVSKEAATWVNAFPKASWINAATAMRAFGDIESGKAFNWLLFLAAFFLLLDLFRQFSFRRSFALALAVAVTANPVIIYQLFSYYVDGQVAALMTIVFALMIRVLLGLPARRTVVLLVAGLMLLTNLKFTALIYGTALSGLFFIFCFHYRPRSRHYLWVAFTPMIGVALSVLIVGYNPYMTNYQRHRNVFYPVPIPFLSGSGNASVPVMPVSNMPENFAGKSSIEKLLRSVTAFSGNITAPKSTRFKWPWQIDVEEYRCFTIADCRIGGFGPLFEAELVGAAILLVLIFNIFGSESFVVLGMLSAGIMGTTLLNPECWWARYVPQIWLIPCIISFFAVYPQLKVVKTRRRIGYVLIGLVCLNSLLIAGVYVRSQYRGTGKALERLAAYQTQYQTEGKPLAIDFGRFRSFRLKFEKAGIPYTELGQLEYQ